jgi:hypothetical protein
MGGFRGDIGGGGSGGFNMGSGVTSPGPSIPIGPPQPDIGIVPGLGQVGSTPMSPGFIPDAASLEALFGPQPSSTFFVGLNFHAIGGSGLTLSVGAYVDFNTLRLGFIPTAGNFITVPQGPTTAASARGVDPSVSLTGGFVAGPLSGPFSNQNLGVGPYSGSLHYNASGQAVGFSLGLGRGPLPVTYSETMTNTWLFPHW